VLHTRQRRFRHSQHHFDNSQGAFLPLPYDNSSLLTPIQDFMVNEQDYVELVLNCAEICRALDRGTNGKILDDLSQSVREAINQLTT
jgi:hypothetical protein